MAVSINGTNGLIQAYDYQVLTTGFSYTFSAGTQTLVINPAGTLATGTITMPAAPSDGMTITFSTTKQITALTLNGNTGQTIVSGVSSMTANSSATYVYRASGTSWYPMQTVPAVVANTQIGVGQTWTNMSGSRAMGTTYTNSTGKPIEVAVSPQGGGQLTYTIVINGTTVAQTGSNAGEYMPIIVPDGATYSFTNSGGTGFVYWFELR